MKTRVKTKLYVCAYDLHFPQHNRETWDALMDFVSRNRVSGFIWGGDQFHNDEISHHTKGKGKFRPKGSFKSNEKYFDADILKPLEQCLPIFRLTDISMSDISKTDLCRTF